MKRIEQLKNAAVAACILLCFAMVSCPTDDDRDKKPPKKELKSVVLDWDWEVVDDRNPNKWAPGISWIDLDCFTVSDTKFAQVYVLNEPYVSGQPETGWYKVQSPNGVDRVTMEDGKGYDASLTWPDNRGAGAKIPMMVPNLVETTGPDGKTVKAFHFTGTLVQVGYEEGGDQQPRTGSNYQTSCGWPSIAWSATPAFDDPEESVRNKFIDGYGYTFWVKVDSDPDSFVAYRTSVENWDFRPNEGHEPGHWFGVGTGRDGTQGVNYTPTALGEWKKVTVIYNPYDPGFNMAVNKWIVDYSIQNNYSGDREPYDIIEDYDTTHSIRIMWTVQLQHNGGQEGSNVVEYSVVSGRHEYDVWFYGLEILQY